ncbi:hypothetical protein ACHAXH_009535 [Discostella pseudostelligera]
MKLSTITLALAQFLSIKSTVAFRAGNDGNGDLMKKALEEALLVNNPQETKSTSVADAPPIRNKILGTEVPCMFEYWSRPDIHTFGNVGFGGAVHAAMAPIATKIIDVKAYGGVDVRKNIAAELRMLVNKTGARVADLCCGVGMSTRALESAFHDAEELVGIDTSNEMISMAGAISGHNQGINLAIARYTELLKKIMPSSRASRDIETTPSPFRSAATQASYRIANAENTKLPNLSFDLVTIMYGFHEVPMEGRARILDEARRLLRRGGHLAIVDICPTYKPAEAMLAGEPFVLEYQQNIDSQLTSLNKFRFTKRKSVVPGHVNLWLLTAA